MDYNPHPLALVLAFPLPKASLCTAGGSASSMWHSTAAQGLRGLQGVGLQPENLADRLLVAVCGTALQLNSCCSFYIRTTFCVAWTARSACTLKGCA
eukprot:1159741-Pelagomonas_calceolata.AAC.1